jgi:hypothetical protein
MLIYSYVSWTLILYYIKTLNLITVSINFFVSSLAKNNNNSELFTKQKFVISLNLLQGLMNMTASKMYGYQTAIHVFQKKEFAFENVIGAIGKILVGVGVRELVFDNVGTGVDQPRV